MDVSTVGLYEFLWLLRGNFPDVDDQDLRNDAMSALTHLLNERLAHLVLVKWPEDVILGEASGTIATDDQWKDPQASKPYVAVARN
jgi:hypothetical protein